LKKASRNSSFTSVKVSSMWKPKFVELRHGVFSYEDDFSGRKKAMKKNISLSVGTCYCQMIKMKEKDGECVFELSVRGGSRRLWQAASSRDRDAWINAINSAMMKSSERFLEPPLQSNDTTHNNTIKLLLDQSVLNNGYNSSYKRERDISSSDGAAAPYADEISRYSSIQSAVKSVETVESYRGIIDRLKTANLQVTVPVFFVKNHMSYSSDESRAFATSGIKKKRARIRLFSSFFPQSQNIFV
jgi:hypothetical protein